MLLKQLVEKLMEIQISVPGSDDWEICNDMDYRELDIEPDEDEKVIVLAFS